MRKGNLRYPGFILRGLCSTYCVVQGELRESPTLEDGQRPWVDGAPRVEADCSSLSRVPRPVHQHRVLIRAVSLGAYRGNGLPFLRTSDFSFPWSHLSRICTYETPWWYSSSSPKNYPVGSLESGAVLEPENSTLLLVVLLCLLLIYLLIIYFNKLPTVHLAY